MSTEREPFGDAELSIIATLLAHQDVLTTARLTGQPPEDVMRIGVRVAEALCGALGRTSTVPAGTITALTRVQAQLEQTLSQWDLLGLPDKTAD